MSELHTKLRVRVKASSKPGHVDAFVLITDSLLLVLEDFSFAKLCANHEHQAAN